LKKYNKVVKHFVFSNKVITTAAASPWRIAFFRASSKVRNGSDHVHWPHYNTKYKVTMLNGTTFDESDVCPYREVENVSMMYL